MPELPDVAVFRRYLDSTSLHQMIESVHGSRLSDLTDLSRRQLSDSLQGRELEKSGRHGKFLFTRMEAGGVWLVLHFGMTGFLKYYRSPGSAPDHIRLRLDFNNGYHLAYSCQRLLGRIDLTDDIGDFVEKQGLGPDALELDESEFRRRMGSKRGGIKSALMDQSLVAGIGNVYSDEILFQAKVNPEFPVADLSDSDHGRLFGTMRQVLLTAIRSRVEVERFPSHYLTRRRQEGASCPNCGGEIGVEKVGGRTSYYCPQCQASP